MSIRKPLIEVMEEYGLLKDNSMQELAAEIKEFLNKHALMSAMEPDEYGSPDACMLFNAALELENDCVPDVVFSTWESGGYSPYTDEKARNWHDNLIKKIKNMR